MDYTRSKAILERTLAYYQFKRDFTTVNDFFWSTDSALQAVSGRVRHMKDTEDFRTALGLGQPLYAKPLGHSPNVYAEQLKVGDRWHRLMALVVMLSAFERYINSAATLAIASDPTLTAGFPKKIDGLTLVKYGLTGGDRPTDRTIRGEWSARRSAFVEYFSGAPAKMTENEAELEIMRVKRNQIAHAFGLDSDRSTSPQTALFLSARNPDIAKVSEFNISRDRLKKWLAIVEQTATAVDRHLLDSFIGGYEVAAIYIEIYRVGQRPRCPTRSDRNQAGQKRFHR